MYPELGQIGPLTIRTYTVIADVAILIGLVALARQGKLTENRPGAWLDAGLLAVLGGLIGGRLAHAAIHWTYFVGQPAEIVQVWRGGLDWHGAVLGGLAMLWVGCRARRVNWRLAADALAWVVPLGALLINAACAMSRCGYGREVATLASYPFPVAAEMPDIYGITVPRLASQFYGMAACGLVLLAVWRIRRMIRIPGVAVWPTLALVALATFGVGYTRGDPVLAVAGLRLDQWLDLAVAGLALGALAWSARTGSKGVSDPQAGETRSEGLSG